MTLLNESERTRLAERAGDSLIADILGDNYGGERGFFRRVVTCRADFQGRTLVALALVPHGLSSLIASDGGVEIDVRRLRRRLLDEVRRAVQALDAAAVSGLEDDTVLSIVGVAPTTDIRGAADRLGRDVAARVAALPPDEVAPVVGLSSEASPRALRRAVEQAREAADCGASLMAARVVHAGDLGLQHLLLRLSEGPELARFVDDELRPLLDHDAKRGSMLVTTLRAYLDCGCRKSRAAEALTLQRRSLYHRLERIQEVLGIDLGDDETMLRLHVALRGFDLLRRRSPVA